MSQGIATPTGRVPASPSEVRNDSNSDPIAASIRSSVKRFSRMRLRWSIARASIALGLVLGIGWMLSILLDGFLWLEPWVRITLAIALWLLAIGIAWRAGLSEVLSSSSLVDRAREMEQRHPHFQEKLIASVDFDTPTIASRGFSPDFIHQTKYAALRELRQVDWNSLIPWRQLQQPTLALLLLGLTAFSLSLFPNLQFQQRWLRVAFPFLDVNIPRSWRIEFLSPTVERFEAPSQQIIGIAVRARSLKNQTTNPEKAVIEFHASEQSSAPDNRFFSVALKPDASTSDVFIAKVPIGEQPIRYRAVIDDAASSWRTLVPLLRPHPVRFQGSVIPPIYSGLERRSIDQEQGDLQVMAGSSVELRIAVDQPLERATVTIEDLETGEQVERKMARGSEDREWTFDWKADRSAKYQLQLDSKTRFEGESLRNTLSTRYRIDAIADPASEIQWFPTDRTLWQEPPLPDQTWLTTLEVPISLAAQVTDNLEVQSIVLEYSLNDEAWKTCAYNAACPPPSIEWEDNNGSRRKALLEWDWDPMTCQAKAGDTLQLRLVSVDRAEQTSYSSLLRYAITSESHDPKRYDVLKSRMRIAKPLLALKNTIEASSKQIDEWTKKLEPSDKASGQPDTAAADRLQTLQEMSDWGQQARTSLQGILQIVEEELPSLERGIDQRDLEWMAQAAQTLTSEHLPRIDFAFAIAREQQKSGEASNRPESERERMQQAIHAVRIVQDVSRHLAHVAQVGAAFEMLSTLTVDMQELANLQKKNSRGSDNWTLPQWKRSQMIADQVWIDAKERIGRYLAELPRGTADGLADWQKWMEDSRQSNRDTLEPLQGGAELSKISERIRTDSNELRDRSWMFRYDNIPHQSQAARHELIMGKRQPVFHSLESLLQKLRAHDSLAKNPSTSTASLAESMKIVEMEWRMVGESSAERLLLQRSTHQLRKSQDTAFSADLGLASRAWRALISQWFESPSDRESTRRNLELVSQAIRVLEGAHEFHDAQQSLSALAVSERYADDPFEALAYAAPTLGAIAKGLENAHRRLRETGRIDNKVLDRLQAVLWQPDYTTANEKLYQRMNEPLAPFATIAPHLDAWIAYLHGCDREMEPVFEEARETLRRFAPTVSELAEKAAQSARQLKKATETQKESREKGDSQTNNDREQIEAERENLNEDAEELRQALSEMASQQNLLQPDQMALAKDSDQAAELVERVMDRLNESLDAAMTTEEEASTEQAIADQSNAAKAMETIAKHFSPQDPDATQAKNDLPSFDESLEADLASSMDSQALDSRASREDAYERADQLQKLASADPRALLQELERELPNNPAMQRELSEIAKAAATNAIQELQRAATKEKELQLQLENQDLQLAAQKARKVTELQAIMDEADRLAKTLLEKGEQLTYRIPSAKKSYDELRMEMRQQIDSLRTSLQSARQVNSRSSSDEIESKSQELRNAFAEGKKAVSNLKDQARELGSQRVERDEQKRLNRVTEAGNAQNSIRNDVRAEANRLVKQWKDQLGRVDNESKRLEKDVARQQEQLQKTIEQAAKNPTNGSLAEQQKRSEGSLEALRESLERNQETSRWTQQIVSNLENRARGLDERAKNSLNTPNPYGALIEEQLEQASQLLQQLEQRAGELTSDARSLPEPKTPSSTLEQAALEQERTRENVSQVAKDLERGARHEERLGNPSASQSLQGQAAAVEAIDTETLKPAESSLQRAAHQAAQQEQSDTTRTQKNSPAIARPETTDSNMALSKAEQALREQAAVLQESLARSQESSNSNETSKPTDAPSDTNQSDASNAPTGAPRSSGSQKSSGSTPTDSGPASQSGPSSGGQQVASASAEAQQRGVEMARLLDQLDRAQNGPMAPAETGDSNESAVQDVSRLDANSDANQVRDHKGSMASALQSAATSMAQSLASEMSQQRQMQAQRNPIGQTYLRDQRASKMPQRGLNPSIPDRSEDYFLPSTVKGKNRDWGRLRTQKAEQVLEGTRETFDPEFDAAIRAYYQAIATPSSKER